jgi:hypothetical protein
MSRKELPRAGLVVAAVAGRISNREGAAALRMWPRHFQRLKGASAGRGAAGTAPSRARPAVAPPVAGGPDRARAGPAAQLLCRVQRHPRHRATARGGRPGAVARIGAPPAAGAGAAGRASAAPGAASPPPPARAGRGQLVQLDGSPLAWLQDRGPALTLLGAIDDATSQVVACDGVNILVRTDRHWTLAEQMAGRQAPDPFGPRAP